MYAGILFCEVQECMFNDVLSICDPSNHFLSSVDNVNY